MTFDKNQDATIFVNFSWKWNLTCIKQAAPIFKLHHSTGHHNLWKHGRFQGNANSPVRLSRHTGRELGVNWSFDVSWVLQQRHFNPGTGQGWWKRLAILSDWTPTIGGEVMGLGSNRRRWEGQEQTQRGRKPWGSERKKWKLCQQEEGVRIIPSGFRRYHTIEWKCYNSLTINLARR